MINHFGVIDRGGSDSFRNFMGGYMGITGASAAAGSANAMIDAAMTAAASEALDALQAKLKMEKKGRDYALQLI
jgi:hypothetical protein